MRQSVHSGLIKVIILKQLAQGWLDHAHIELEADILLALLGPE